MYMHGGGGGWGLVADTSISDQFSLFLCVCVCVDYVQRRREEGLGGVAEEYYTCQLHCILTPG